MTGPHKASVDGACAGVGGGGGGWQALEMEDGMCVKAPDVSRDLVKSRAK